MERDLHSTDGWLSHQNLLTHTIDEKKGDIRSYRIERRVSYRKAVEQARKIHPELFSVKSIKPETEIQDGPKVNVAIELNEFPASNSTSEDPQKCGQDSSIGATDKLSLWTRGRKSLKKVISVASTVAEGAEKYKKKKKQIRFQQEEEPETAQARAERGMLYMLFRPHCNKC